MFQAQEMEKVCYSVDEACRVLSIGRSQLYKEVRAGRLKARQSGRRKVFTRVELERWANNLPHSVSQEETSHGS